MQLPPSHDTTTNPAPISNCLLDSCQARWRTRCTLTTSSSPRQLPPAWRCGRASRCGSRCGGPRQRWGALFCVQRLLCLRLVLAQAGLSASLVACWWQLLMWQAVAERRALSTAGRCTAHVCHPASLRLCRYPAHRLLRAVAPFSNRPRSLRSTARRQRRCGRCGATPPSPTTPCSQVGGRRDRLGRRECCGGTCSGCG